MNLSAGCRIVLCFVLVTLKDTFGQLKPSNAVTEIGGEAIFNCSGTLFLPNWILSKDGTSTNQLPIAGSCNVNANLDDHYRTERTGGPTTCNLIVFNVTMAQAGVYLCVESAAISNALLTVLDSSPNITYNNTPDVMERENIVITCTLNYSGSVEPAPTLRPHFYWTDYTGNNVSSFYDSTPVNSPVISQIAVTAGRQDIMPYTCHVYLKLMPTATSGYADKAPPVNSSASSQNIAVLYSPGNISIASSVLPKDECVQKQESLTCTADAKPSAQYEWLDLNNNTISQGSIKSITSGGRFQCTAYNDIRTKRYNQTKTAEENSCYSVKEDNMTISGPGCTNDSCYCTGNQPLILTCEVYSLPTPTYRWWYDVFQTEYYGNKTIRAEYDGNYSCTANSSFGANSSKATVSARVFNCTPHPPISKAWIIVPVWVILCWILPCLCLLIYHNVPTLKDACNKRFPVLTKMLPCLNKESSAEAASKADCGNVECIILYIVMVAFVGLFAIPIMFFIVQCSNPNSKESTDNVETESSEELAHKSTEFSEEIAEPK